MSTVIYSSVSLIWCSLKHILTHLFNLNDFIGLFWQERKSNMVDYLEEKADLLITLRDLIYRSKVLTKTYVRQIFIKNIVLGKDYCNQTIFRLFSALFMGLKDCLLGWNITCKINDHFLSPVLTILGLFMGIWENVWL